MLRRSAALAVAIPSAGFLLVAFLLPLGMVIQGGFVFSGRWTLEYVLSALNNPVYRAGWWTSLSIATGTTLLATLLALPLAWLSVRYEFPGRAWVTSAVLWPMVLPPFVGALGLQQILGRYGALNALLGTTTDWLGIGRLHVVIVVQALALFPIVWLNVSASLANVDPSLEEAATVAGATAWRTFRHVTLPLIMPGLIAGASLVFIWSFTELGTPLMLGLSRCTPVQIYDGLKDIGMQPEPYALVALMLIGFAALFATVRVWNQRHAYASLSRSVQTRSPTRLRGWKGTACLLPFVAVLALALLPHVGVILTAVSDTGQWYRSVLPTRWTWTHWADALGHELTLRSIRNSLVYAGTAVALDLALALGISWVSARSHVPWRGWLDTLATLPLAVPGLVMAFGYLALSARLSHHPWVRSNPWLLSWLDVRESPALFLVIAYAIRRLPYLVRAAAAGWSQVPPVLEEAAAVAGASPARVVRTITLPLIAAHLVGGAILTFAFCLLEVSDSLILAQRMDGYPVTKTIYELFALVGPGPHLAAALGAWAMAFLALSLAVASRLLGRNLGSLFRV